MSEAEAVFTGAGAAFFAAATGAGVAAVLEPACWCRCWLHGRCWERPQQAPHSSFPSLSICANGAWMYLLPSLPSGALAVSAAFDFRLRFFVLVELSVAVAGACAKTLSVPNPITNAVALAINLKYFFIRFSLFKTRFVFNSYKLSLRSDTPVLPQVTIPKLMKSHRCLSSEAGNPLCLYSLCSMHLIFTVILQT